MIVIRTLGFCLHCQRAVTTARTAPGIPVHLVVPGEDGKRQDLGRMDWPTLVSLVDRGGAVRDPNGFELGIYAEFLVAGTGMCYGHAWKSWQEGP